MNEDKALAILKTLLNVTDYEYEDLFDQEQEHDPKEYDIDPFLKWLVGYLPGQFDIKEEDEEPEECGNTWTVWSQHTLIYEIDGRITELAEWETEGIGKYDHNGWNVSSNDGSSDCIEDFQSEFIRMLWDINKISTSDDPIAWVPEPVSKEG